MTCIGSPILTIRASSQLSPAAAEYAAQNPASPATTSAPTARNSTGLFIKTAQSVER